MAITFPTSLDALTNPVGTDLVSVVDHAGQHSDVNDAVEALEAKVGINGSAVATSLDYKINNLTTASVTASTNKNYVTDAQAVVIGNTSNTNSGDNATNTQYSGLVSNATHTGDATGATALTLATVNSNVGTFTNSTVTVNAKGLVTAASSGTTPATLSFTNFAVSGQSNVVADSATDTLTLEAGANVTLTTNAATDTITIASTGGGTTNYWGSLVYANTTVPAGNTVTSTSETAFTSSYTIPAATLAAGDVVRVKLFGVYSGTVLPSIRGKMKFGSTVLLDTTAISGLVTGTNMGWWAEGLFVVQTAGASGAIESQGFAEFGTAATTGLSVNTPNSAAITVDTTASQAVTVSIQWGVGGTAQTITLREMTVEVLRANSGSANTVSNGGTGNTSLTANAVLLGEGTAAVGFATVGTAGRVFVDKGAAADPAFVVMSGDATLNSSGAITIANSAVTLAKQADMATASVVYRKTAGAGAPEVNTLATLKTDLGLTGTNSGDQTTITGNAGTATALQNARTIGGVSFDGTANIVPQTIQSINEATDTTCFPLFISASGAQSLQPLNNTALTFNSNTGALGATSFSGAGTNLTGTAASLTAGAVTTNANLTGDVTSVGNATTLTNAPVIAKVLTGYVSGAGTVAATDSILQAIQKLNGNDATNANLTGVITSVGNATSIASQTGTGTKFVVDNTPTLITPVLGVATATSVDVGTNATAGAGGYFKATQTSITEAYLRNDGVYMKNIYVGGGWARNLLSYADSADAQYMAFGGYGTGQTFTRAWIGATYDTPWIDFNATTTGFYRPSAATANPTSATKNFTFMGGATSPVLGAATADMVSVAGVDNGAGNREFQVQPEAGGFMAYGNNALRFSASTTVTANSFVGALTGNATTVTTNANLTGAVTSVGNAASLGSFTLAQLNTAVSDADVARTDAANTFTGVQTMTSPAITTPAITGLATGTGVSATATVSTLASRDASGNSGFNNALEGYTTTATAAGTTTLTVASTWNQFFTGSTTQTVTLPVTSTLVLGHSFVIDNASTGLVTINSSGANAVLILAAGTSAVVTCILTSGTTAASWKASYSGANAATGKKVTVNNTLTLAGTDATTMTFPTTSATIARTDAANTFTGTQTVGALVATTLNGNTFTTGTYTLTGTAAKTLNFTNTLTLAGTDSTTMTFPTTSATIARTDAANTFTGVQTMTSPAITTPAITGLATGSGVASAATVSTLASRDANGNSNFVNVLEGYTTTATAAGTTTLTVASNYQQFFTGSTTQIVQMPVTSTLALGHSFQIVNNSTGAVTINSSGSNAITILSGGTSAIFTCILTSGTTAASWSVLNPLQLSANGGQIAGLRNALINGAFNIWQRGTASTALTTASAYLADRWYGIMQITAAGTMQQNTSVPSGVALPYSIRIGRDNLSTNTNTIRLGQIIETNNSIPLQGQQVTLSYYAKAGANFSAASSQILVSVWTGTGTDQGAAGFIANTWTGFATPLNSVATTITTTWTRYTHTFVLASTVKEIGAEVRYACVGTAGADDNIYIAGMQLEYGAVATPFENRPFSTEQDLCRRYYEKTFSYATAAAQNAGTTGAQAVLLPTGVTGTFGLSVPMYPKRTAPTITTYNPSGGNASWRDTTSASDRAVTVGTIGESSFIISGAAGLAATTNLIHWSAASEL